MRLIGFAVALACAACASGTGPPAPDSIAGRWSSWGPGHAVTPAGPEIVTLTESGTEVSGSDSLFGQARSVTGQYVRPTISLDVLPHDQHQILLYAGKALDANRIQLNGTIFYRQ